MLLIARKRSLKDFLVRANRFLHFDNIIKGVIRGYGRVSILLEQNMARSWHYIPGPCFIYTQSAVRGPQSLI